MLHSHFHSSNDTEKKYKNDTISLSWTAQEGSYWGQFLALQWLISFQESMTKLNAGHHLSMGSNFEEEQHIGWKIYLKNCTALKMRKASWEGCFIICYCICLTFSVIYVLYLFSLSCLSTFFFFTFHTLCSCKYFLVLKIFLFCSYSPPPSVTQLLFYSSLGAISKVHSYENAWDASFCE